MASQVHVGMRGYLRDTGECWGEVVDIASDEVTVRTQYDNIIKCAVYEICNWLRDGVLGIVRPEMHEIHMEGGRIFYADTVTESPGEFTAYWKRGNGPADIGTKVILVERVSRIIQGGKVTFQGDTPKSGNLCFSMFNDAKLLLESQVA